MVKHKKPSGVLLSLITLGCILLIALLLRSEMFIHQDFYYLIDQARDLVLVKDIVVNQNITLIGARSGVGGIFHGPLWLYMLVPTFILSGGHPFYTLVPVFLIIGIATVAAGYFVGTKLYNKTVGLVTAAFLAITPLLIDATVSMTNAQVMPLIFILYLYAVITFLRGSDRHFILCALLIGLGIHFEAAFAIYLIPLTLVVVALRKKLPRLKYVLFAIGTFILTVSTYVLFEIRNGFLMTNTIIQLFQNKREPLKGYEQFSDIGFRVQDRLLHLKESFFLFLTNQDPLSVLIVSSILIAGMYVVIRQIIKTKKFDAHTKEYFFMLLIPIGYYLLFILYPYPLWEHYILPLTVSSVFLFALSLNFFINKKESYFMVGIVLVLLLYPALNIIKNTNFTTPSYAQSGTFKTQRAVSDFVFQDAAGKPFGYFVYYPGILTYSMDYLMWWSGKKYKNTPSDQKQHTTYLIMYPPVASDNSAHAFWKKNVVRTSGEVVKRQEFPSGIVVEKLKIESSEGPADSNYYQNLIFR